MANKKFTQEDMAILKANPYILEVTEDIIHFSASFKSSFWDRLQNGMKPPDIFRELGIDQINACIARAEEELAAK